MGQKKNEERCFRRQMGLDRGVSRLGFILGGNPPHGVAAVDIPQSGMGFERRVNMWYPLCWLAAWMIFQVGLNW
jgi:hypothetical protein